MDKRSKRFQISQYDIYSWAKNVWAVVVMTVVVELLKVLPQLQEVGVGYLNTAFEGNQLLTSLSSTLVASLGLFLKKLLTDYTQK